MKEGQNLVIVESPGKIKKIKSALGSDYTVMASIGHIRDLQDSGLSIDIENGFAPQYVVPAEKKKTVSELKKAAKEATTVWLASDADREGEAISWHLYETLGLKKENTKRIVFQEITKPALLEAIQNPREINMDLVNAQQARRVLDRLVGFELSPVLWRKIQPKLSAGRVQSVALRLIVDREREILAFNKEAYYKVEAVFHPEGTPEKTPFDHFYKVYGGYLPSPQARWCTQKMKLEKINCGIYSNFYLNLNMCLDLNLSNIFITF